MIIKPAVAGMFYPSDPVKLQQMVKEFLANASEKASLPIPKAIIAPHAGYIYSGPIAASAYACLAKAKNLLKKVVVLAPAHRYPIEGIGITKANTYQTPLGMIPIDQKAVALITNHPEVVVTEAAFSTEHAIEVHLPFLQSLLADFSLIPLLVGFTSIANVVKVLETLWGDQETLIVISSDLSHYNDDATAKKLDHQTSEAILALNPDAIDNELACGATGIKGLLTIAASKKLKATLVDLRNSGDTAGPKDSVVGYGAFHLR